MQTQLQIMSTYTLLKSTITIDKLVKAAKERGCKSIALTDHNVLYGAIEFYEKSLKAGLNPILGLTLDIESLNEETKEARIVLLAKNETGFKELIKLSTKIMTEEKAIALDFLKNECSQLIAITPGANGEVEQLLLAGDFENAEKILYKYSEVFEELYLGYAFQTPLLSIQEQLIELSKHTNIELVAFDAVEYLDREDAFATDVLRTIGANEMIDMNKDLEQEKSLLSARERTKQYENAGLIKLAETADQIAEKISINITLGKPVLPKFPIPNGRETDEYLSELCWQAVDKKIGEVTLEYKNRLEKELAIISKMGFSDYFLIVWDLMRYAHSQKIITGSGRGSAVGSLVSYVLDITDVDPIKYGLLFERFLNEERFSMPDIDLDFPDNKREQMLAYVNKKYGNQHVAQIATFGTFAAKMAVRDSGRVFGLTTKDLKRWSDAIPTSLGMTLAKAFKESSKLQSLIKESDQNRKIYETAKKLEGLPRHVSTHAAGVVISDEPLIHSVPLQLGSGELSLTQFTMSYVEKVGLLKMDFLGLKNLTILSDCIQFASTQTNRSLSLSNIPLNDYETLQLFRNGDTNGVFQFESPGIKRVLRKLGPTDIEDVVAVNALYRPGPMEQIDTFIARKKGNEPIVYPHDDLEEILDVTYGIMVYQEQVMKVASKLAGYSLAEADMLRRAISKKIRNEIDTGRKQFIRGATQKGYTEETAKNVYHYIEQFANYGFNRSHAVAYSMVAYQLAYFKVHYPAAFYAALMKASSNNKTKLQEYVIEAKKRGVEMIGPDINMSNYTFSLYNGTILFGLDVIKGLRRDLVYSIYKIRKEAGPYKDIIDFIGKLENKWRKEIYIKPLVFAGTFDRLIHNRGTIIHSLDGIINSVNMSNGNMELFESLAPKIEIVEDLPLEEKLDQEYEVTGFYLSNHPSEQYNKYREAFKADFIADAKTNRTMKFIGTIKGIKTIQTKKGEPMSFVELTDQTGSCSLTLFPEQHRKYIKHLSKGDAILVEGKVESDQKGVKILVRKIENTKELKEIKQKEILYLKFESIKDNEEVFRNVQSILRQHPGEVSVVIFDASTDQKHLLKKAYSIDGSKEVVAELKEILGEKQVVLQ
ncbi:DNA polymerase III catalytic subunit, DnaE type [Marinilactibacillus piezotolerans]|uniref:DNA polymerase III subunit alpha n=1 Tax=Marinilactibacillus piezotolerans TaxID=258723 RepID=A0A1I3VPG8_9LACT|nr:DNA polymerase III subunit alpha [Marinilactibacillus piezotolerans]SFJ97052.1 DNA polymerase III catalytic subunit, DnaE type [Marinilactibacillus piezotolerans]